MAASCGLISNVLELVGNCTVSWKLSLGFSWHCPSCLFSELPSIDVVELDTPTSQSSISSFESITLPVDALKKPFSEVHIIHHNVQDIPSKMDELTS